MFLLNYFLCSIYLRLTVRFNSIIVFIVSLLKYKILLSTSTTFILTVTPNSNHREARNT